MDGQRPAKWRPRNSQSQGHSVLDPPQRGSSLQVPGGSARQCRKGGAHVRSWHLIAWGSDMTGCPAVSHRRAVTAAFQGLSTHVCYDGHWMPSVWSSS